MDDIGKALIMGAQVLMFAFAATIAIYLYSSITSRVNGVMLANNYSNRGDAIVADQDTNTTRTATKAEVIMAILDLKNKYEKTGEIYSVKVNSTYFIYDNTGDIIRAGASLSPVDLNIQISNSSTGRTKLLNIVNDINYTLTYTEDGKILEYN